MAISSTEVLTQLSTCRESGGYVQETVQICLQWLLQQDYPRDADGSQHWYCDRAFSPTDKEQERHTLYETRTFLVRLRSFHRKSKVAVWAANVDQLLIKCSDCVQGWEASKFLFSKQYLVPDYSRQVVEEFEKALNGKEAERITNAFKAFKPLTMTTLRMPIPIPVLYHILLSPSLFSRTDVQNLVLSVLPSVEESASISEPSMPLLNSTVLPGLFAFAVNPDERLQIFAKEQLKMTTNYPPATPENTTQELLYSTLHRTIDSILSFLVFSRLNPQYNHSGTDCYVSDRIRFWNGLYEIIERLPSYMLNSPLAGLSKTTSSTSSSASRTTKVSDIRRVICGYLGDDGPQLSIAISCWVIILKRLESKTWDVQDSDYAQVIMNTLIDNPVFERESQKSFSKYEFRPQNSPFFSWIIPFLRSIADDKKQFTVCLSYLTQALLVRFQGGHIDQQERTYFLHVALSVFTEIFIEKSHFSDTRIVPWKYATHAAPSVLDVVADLLVKKAYDITNKSQSDNSTIEGSRAISRFLEKIAEQDANRLVDNVYLLASRYEEFMKNKIKEFEPVQATFAQRIWEHMYEIGRMNFNRSRQKYYDVKVALLRALVPCFHLTQLSTRSWKLENNANLRSSYASVNRAFQVIQKPITDILNHLSDEDSSALIREFISQDNVPEALIAAIFSPVEKISNGAQSIVRQIYDVISRWECFEQLLLHRPVQTIKGIISATRKFFSAAQNLPEACGAAKILVRCSTDILEILCDTTRGLLLRNDWIEKDQLAGQMQIMWALMCKTIALIFEKTPIWAPFYENEEMTGWMRDAILFADLLQSKVHVFERAITASSTDDDDILNISMPSPSQLSSAGSKMVAALSEPLAKLMSWLRLNDSDLLQLSGTLLRSFVHRLAKARVSIDDLVLKKLFKMAQKVNSDAHNYDQVMALIGVMSEHPLHAQYFSSFSKALAGFNAEQSSNSNNAGTGLDEDPDVVILDEKPSDKHHKARKSNTTSTSQTTQFTLPGVAPFKSLKSDSTLSSWLLPSSNENKSGQNGQKLNSTPRLSATDSAGQRPRISSINVTKPSKNGRLDGRKNVNTVKPAKRLTYSHAAHQAAREKLGSSSSEDDSDEEQGKGMAGLAAMANIQNHLRTKQDSGGIKRSTKIHEEKFSVNHINRVNMSRQRANDRAARLRAGPADYSALYRQILKWDIKSTTEAPPDTYCPPKANRSHPIKFKTPLQYIEHFKALIILECWSALRQVMEDLPNSDIEPVGCTVAQRTSVDDFIEVSLSVNGGKISSKGDINESNLVILRQGQARMVLAKVQSINSKREQTDIVLRCNLANDQSGVTIALAPRTQWEVVRLFSLSTLLRGWGALHSSPLYNLSNEIVHAFLPPLPQIPEDEVQKISKNYNVNLPQASAIAGAMATQGFSLIQGPPGTGKTKTIIGLVTAVLSQKRSGCKVLLCAPSNAAVDEVARRLKEITLDDEDGKLCNPKIVRIGVSDSINVSVQDILLDELIEREVNGNNDDETKSSELAKKITAIRNKIDGLKAKRLEKQSERLDISADLDKCSKLDFEIQTIKRDLNQQSTELQDLLDKRTQSDRKIDASRRKAREKIITEADVICATLSGAGHDYMSALPFDFDTVIIDEAAQSVEVDSLIPLKYGCQRCVMVGDPNQLPPTVLSKAAKDSGYDQSLFLRFQLASPNSVHLLSIQYRMHPQISAFPSKHFYNSDLKDGPSLAEKTAAKWHKNPLFPPYAFLDVSGGVGGEEMSRVGHSRLNKLEAEVILALYTRLKFDFPDVNLDYRIGIVTPYKGQMRELKRQFRNKFGDDILSKVDFNTVDGFQGQEKSIIILSCVRGHSNSLRESQEIGFLKDVRRMNVGLTRAVSSLFIVGNSIALGNNKQWGPLVDDAKERGVFRAVTQRTYNLHSRPVQSPEEDLSVRVSKRRNRNTNGLGIEENNHRSSSKSSKSSKLSHVSPKAKSSYANITRTKEDNQGRSPFPKDLHKLSGSLSDKERSSQKHDQDHQKAGEDSSLALDRHTSNGTSAPPPDSSGTSTPLRTRGEQGLAAAALKLQKSGTEPTTKKRHIDEDSGDNDKNDNKPVNKRFHIHPLQEGRALLEPNNTDYSKPQVPSRPPPRPQASLFIGKPKPPPRGPSRR